MFFLWNTAFGQGLQLVKLTGSKAEERNLELQPSSVQNDPVLENCNYTSFQGCSLSNQLHNFPKVTAIHYLRDGQTIDEKFTIPIQVAFGSTVAALTTKMVSPGLPLTAARIGVCSADDCVEFEVEHDGTHGVCGLKAMLSIDLAQQHQKKCPKLRALKQALLSGAKPLPKSLTHFGRY